MSETKQYYGVEIPETCKVRDFSALNMKNNSIIENNRKDPNEYYQIRIELNDYLLEPHQKWQRDGRHENFSQIMLELFNALNNNPDYASKWLPNNPEGSGIMPTLLNTENHSRIYMHPKELSCHLTAAEFDRVIRTIRNSSFSSALHEVTIVAHQIPYYEEAEFEKLCSDILNDKEKCETFIALGKNAGNHDCMAIIPRVSRGFDCDEVKEKCNKVLSTPDEPLYLPGEKPIEDVFHNSLRYFDMVKKIEEKFPELKQQTIDLDRD